MCYLHCTTEGRLPKQNFFSTCMQTQRRQSLLYQSRYTIVYVKVREKYDYYALQRTIKVLVAFLSLSAIVLVKILRSHMIF